MSATGLVHHDSGGGVGDVMLVMQPRTVRKYLHLLAFATWVPRPECVISRTQFRRTWMSSKKVPDR